MLKQKSKPHTSLKTALKLRQLPGLVIAIVLVLSFAAGPLVRADQFDEQIKQLNQDSSAKRGQRAQLGSEAASLGDKIAKLQSQISTLQAQIDQYQGQINDLQNQIAAQEAELARQKHVLGENIRTMYLEGDITTLEMLASSKDLSEFVDKQQYRNAVQNKVKDTMDKIVELKHKLKAQKEENEGLLKDKQAAQNELNSQQGEANGLLSLNESQQSSLNSQIRNNNLQVAALRSQQLASNRRLGGSAVAGDPGHGGYPAQWDYPVPQDSRLDNWGMYNRECVSYTAWKVYQTFGYMPGWGWRSQGNANQWPGAASADGIPTGSSPRPNSVAISMGGAYGHAMWVEAVSGNTIYVSQYNYGLDGRYSEMSINGSGLTYIYF